MKGDFTRDTFYPANHFCRVLMQQGRVQLDADWNEQTAILLHYLRSLGADLIGPHGGPADVLGPDGKPVEVNCGFEMITDSTRIEKVCLLTRSAKKELLATLLKDSKPPILIGKGHYYVAGVLCENENYIAYSAQPGDPFPSDLSLEDNESYLLQSRLGTPCNLTLKMKTKTAPIPASAKWR